MIQARKFKISFNLSASPEDVQSLAQECFDAQLDLDDGEIQTLAAQINNAIVGVANVEQILADTADDLGTAQALKTRAETVRDEAIAQREVADNVTNLLSEAYVRQDAAEIAVSQTRTDIDSARSDLGQVLELNSNFLGLTGICAAFGDRLALRALIFGGPFRGRFCQVS